MASDAIRLLLLSAILLTFLTAPSFGAVKVKTTVRGSPKKPTTVTTKMPVTEGFRESRLNPGIIQTCDARYMTLLHEEMIFEAWSEKLKNSSVHPLNGSMPLIFSNQRLIYEIEDIKVVDHDKLKFNAKVSLSNGHALQVDVPKITLRGNYSLAKETGLWKTDNITGNFTLHINGFSVQCKRTMAISKTNREVLRFESTTCSASIDDYDFVVQNPAARDLTALTVDGVVKQHIVDSLLDAVNFFTGFEINYGHDRSKPIYMDMTLLSQPAVEAGRIVLRHRGEICFRNETSGNGNPRKALVPSRLASVQYVVSLFTVGSYCEIVQRHKLLDCNYTQDDLPPDQRRLLSTDDVEHGFGRLFPNASKLFPNATVSIEARTTTKPVVTINKTALHMSFYFRIAVFAINVTNGTKKSIFTADVTMTYNVSLSVKRGRIALYFSLAEKQKVRVVETKIGPLKTEDVLILANQVFAKNMGPFFEIWAKEGIQLSSSKVLHETHSQWKIENQWMVLYLDYERPSPQKSQ